MTILSRKSIQLLFLIVCNNAGTLKASNGMSESAYFVSLKMKAVKLRLRGTILKTLFAVFTGNAVGK